MKPPLASAPMQRACCLRYKSQRTQSCSTGALRFASYSSNTGGSTSSSEATSSSHPGKRNPYRPEPIQPAPPPRKVIVKNLKFGRSDLATSGRALSDASQPSSKTHGLSNPLAAGAPSTSSVVHPVNLKHAIPSGGRVNNERLFATTARFQEAQASSRNGERPSSSSQGLPSSSNGRSSTATPIFGAVLVALLVGGGYVYYTNHEQAFDVQKAREYATSDEPYNRDDLQSLLSSLAPPPPDDTTKPMADRMEVWIKSLQARIVEALERVESATSYRPPAHESSTASREPGSFLRDSWLRKEGGEGISCVLQGGRVFEKAGVNVSVVHGKLPPGAVRAMTADHEGKFKGWYDGKAHLPFKALGISCVIHPHNPSAPTVHFNYRYFEVEDPTKPGVPKAWWFGGGADLTPSYLYPVDVEHFHKTLFDKCDDVTKYESYKRWCDDYFYIKHRGETRGVGGIFFDDLSAAPGDTQGREELFSFVRRCGEGFIESYVPIVARRMHAETSKRMKQWQQLRRGRYVEFNLVYDRGTQFGLRTPGARIESILMSLPLTARWEYYAQLGTEEGSRESQLLQVLKNPKSWVKLDA